MFDRASGHVPGQPDVFCSFRACCGAFWAFSEMLYRFWESWLCIPSQTMFDRASGHVPGQPDVFCSFRACCGTFWAFLGTLRAFSALLVAFWAFQQQLLGTKCRTIKRHAPISSEVRWCPGKVLDKATAWYLEVLGSIPGCALFLSFLFFFFFLLV